MRIGLYGISGVYNFGCEAIVRGAVSLFSSLYPDARITYYSYNLNFDKRALSDLNISICEVKIKRSIVKRINNKIRTLLNCDKRQLFFDYNSIIDSNDVIVSIGGDIYTIPQYIRQHKTYSYYNPLVDFCERAVKKGKKVIVYGGSVGPFGEYSKAKDYYSKYLNNYTAILCREKNSIDYLESIGVRNAFFFSDPAFQVKNNYVNENMKNRFAINLSPLSYYELYGNVPTDTYINLANLIDKIINIFNVEVLLVPHVIADDPKDNDLVFMKKIYDNSCEKDYIKMADYNSGFLGIKKQLATCKLTVAARMHCAINSIVEGVPTIFVSYSQKSVGMCEYVYGDRHWCIGLKDVENELLDRISELYEKHDLITETLAKRNCEIDKEFFSSIEKLRNIIC